MNEIAYNPENMPRQAHWNKNAMLLLFLPRLYKIERTVISKRYVNPLSSWQFPYALQYYNFGVY